MMTNIQKMLEEARELWLDDSAILLKEMEQVLKSTHDEISILILLNSRDGKINPARLRKLQKQVANELRRIRPKLTRKLTQAQKISIEAGIKAVEKISLTTKFAKKAAITPIIWDKLNTEAASALVKYSFGGLPISKRVWDLTWTAEKAIRNQLEISVLTGKSARATARDVKKFLVSPTGPRGSAALDYRPGSGIYKSAYKNAERLARTEINRAFVEGMYAYTKLKPWIVGYIWRTASGEPCPECLDNEGEYYPKESPPTIPAHPNCMCWPEQVYEED